MTAATTTTGSLLLPILVGIPLLASLLLLLIPKSNVFLQRAVGLTASTIAFAWSVYVVTQFTTLEPNFQLVFNLPWIPSMGASIKLGVDGISLWLVVLTTLLFPLVILSTFSSLHERVRELMIVLLLLEVGMIGAFVALDLLLFYLFWEIMLIPMYLLIGIWGGHQRLRASMKFVLYTMLGSLLMLAAILYVFFAFKQASGHYSFDIVELRMLVLPRDVQVWLFAAFALAFAIKVPLFPLHTWLPDAHVQAPTAGSVLLAGVMLKFGIYGFIRFAMPLFPHGSQVLSPAICLLSAAGIVFGAIVAFAQDDIKKLIAYSSVSHLGFCSLGLFAMTTIGIQGSVFAMLSHGLTTGGLFFCIGMLYERRHTRLLSEYGGLWKQMPKFAVVFLIVMLGSVGLPGLSGFVGEFLVLLGSFTASASQMPMPKLVTAVATTGVILGAVYLLYMFQHIMFGPLTNKKNEQLQDLTKREFGFMAPILVLIFVLGFLPSPVLRSMKPSVDWFQSRYYEKLSAPDGPARMTVPLPVTSKKTVTSRQISRRQSQQLSQQLLRQGLSAGEGGR